MSIHVSWKDFPLTVTGYRCDDALSWASENGHDAVVKLLLQAEGVDINSESFNGQTALSWASRSGLDSVVKLLLQIDGIDINPKDGCFIICTYQ